MTGKGSFGRTREDQATMRAFWQVAGLTLAVVATTVLSYVRPDWLQTALTTLSVAAVTFLAIGVPDAWRIWRE